MSRKNSFLWMGLYFLIGWVYLTCRWLFPPGNVFLDMSLALVALALLVPLVLLMKRRERRAREIAFHLAARDEFMRVHASLGDRPPTSFFR